MGNYDRKIGVWAERIRSFFDIIMIIIATLWACVIAVIEGAGKLSLTVLLLATSLLLLSVTAWMLGINFFALVLPAV